MSASPLRLDFGLSCPVCTAGLLSISAPGPDIACLSSETGKTFCWQSYAASGEAGIPPEELQESLWKGFFGDPTRWWDNRKSKLTPLCPEFGHKVSNVPLLLDNRQKPACVDSPLAGMMKHRDSVSPIIVEKGPIERSGALEGALEIGMCSKLCRDGRISDAVDALNLLVQQGCRVDKNLYYRVLKLCIVHKDLVMGRRIHALTTLSGYEGDAYLATQLIGLYASHGRLEEAMQVFSKVCAPSTYNWATIIFAYARHGEAAQAIRLYRQMLKSNTVKPVSHMYVAVLKACATAKDLLAGKEVHAHILASQQKPDIFVQTGLVSMYAKCGSIEDARQVFDRLPERNVVAWTAMIAGYAQQGMGQEALGLYSYMQQDGLTSPNCVTFVCLLQACASVGVGALDQGKQLHLQIQERGLEEDVILGGSLVNMYAKCGNLGDARQVFNRLPERNAVAWTAMLAGYAYRGMGQEALSLYSTMQQEGYTTPDYVTFLCLLQASASVAALPLGKQLHAQIKVQGLHADSVVGAALVNMYAKCGSMFHSQQVFDSLPQKTINAWGALIGGYTRLGESEIVFDLFDTLNLEDIRPDGVIFLCVLTVCSHVGEVEKGRKYFEAMKLDYGISPTIEHYTCMVDLLGRAGRLEEALEMAKTMPIPSTSTVWLTLLGACRKWNNVEIGHQAFELAVSADGEDANSYVLMSNIYASAQMWEEAKEMRARRRKCRVWKKPGQSWWTDIDGVVHTFLAGDKKHSESEGIYARLKQLVPKMKKAGYVPHLESSLRDISDEEKEAELCGHSEKLAIAYALNKTPDGTTIRIAKNLRVCADCHSATAFISIVEKRTIICRDASRFHVYKEGKCSCGDYWPVRVFCVRILNNVRELAKAIGWWSLMRL